MANISLAGLANNDASPGNYLEINFAQGQASSGTTNYSVVLLGNLLSSGSAASMVDTTVFGPDTAIQMSSLSDANLLFGQGSELSQMVRSFLAVNKTSSLYCMPVTESAGAQATGVITVTGTATSNSSLRVMVAGETVDVSVVIGDTPTVIAASIVAAVLSKVDWAVTASSSAGVATLTARQKGTRGNFIRFACRVITLCGVTVTPTAASTAFSGGTTADSNAAALATLSTSRYYYQVSAAEDATQLGALATQIGSMSSAITGLRQRVVGASVDTLANCITLVTGLNNARVEIPWQQSSDQTPAQLAAQVAAVYALGEAQSVPRCNYSGYGSTVDTQSTWLLKAASAPSVAPSRTAIKSALNNGVTPIGVGKGGSTYLVKRITTRSLSGSVSDYRIRDSHKVSISDFFADDLIAKQSLQFSGKLIGNDPVKGQMPAGSDVITPKVLKACCDALVMEYARKDLLENSLDIMAGTIVQRETSPSTRLSLRVPLDIADILDQICSQLNQVG